MKLYRETGTNLLAVLPADPGAGPEPRPVPVLQGMAQNKAAGVLTFSSVAQGREATIFGVPIYG